MACSIVCPLSQGKPVEWKLPTRTQTSGELTKVPSRRGNQLNGNFERYLARYLAGLFLVPSRRGNQLNGNPLNNLDTAISPDRVSPLVGEIS